MANLPELSEFIAAIYQLETTDPIEAGPDGISNLQAEQLASRTRYLKDHMDTAENDINNLETGLSNEVTNRQNADIALQNAINAILPFIPKYRGYFSGVDVGDTSGSLSVGGSVSSAVYQSSVGSTSTVRITIPTMGTTNYFVKISLQSLGTISDDTPVYAPVFKIVSATQFDVGFREGANATQNLRVHIEATTL